VRALRRTDRAAIELDRLLAIVVPGEVRSDFNDVVMQKIQAKNGWRRMLGESAQIFAEPVVAISLALMIVTASLWSRMTSAMERLPDNLTLTLALVAASGMAWISWRIFQTFDVALRVAPCAPAPLHDNLKEGIMRKERPDA
jgi:hypothetical protein